jgi:hypothetical protein
MADRDDIVDLTCYSPLAVHSRAIGVPIGRERSGQEYPSRARRDRTDRMLWNDAATPPALEKKPTAPKPCQGYRPARRIPRCNCGQRLPRSGGGRRIFLMQKPPLIPITSTGTGEAALQNRTYGPGGTPLTTPFKPLQWRWTVPSGKSPRLVRRVLARQ